MTGITIEQKRQELGDDLYDSAKNVRGTLSRLVDRYVATLTDEEVEQAWIDARLVETWDDAEEEDDA